MTAYRERMLAGEYDATPSVPSTVTELRVALKALGLSATGTKSELESRYAEATA